MGLLMIFLLPCVLAGLAAAQYEHQYTSTTPVPILKQINRHNEDGSYSYGYEAADGSYKIESKYPDGEVHGKYGFVDDAGSVREVEYGASRRGFEPTGTGINVPPSTLTGNSITGSNEPEDDGQYREDPSVYHTDPQYTNGERYDPVPKPRPQLRYQKPIAYNPPAPRYTSYRQEPAVQEPQYQQEYRPASVPAQPQYRPQPKANFQPAYSSQYQQSAPAQYRGQPAASDFDLNLSSYTVNYRR